nr:hypothetical protein [Tanacetum cinerariifolium]GEW76467.1 hypothetical protein [Tanacetum cinerariifolium]
MQTTGLSLYWAESARDPMLRLCHRLIACSIVGKSQAPEKVVTDGAPEAVEDAPIADESASAVPAPVQAGVRYTSYTDFQIMYERHTRCKTDDASTSTSQQDEQQLDP